MCQINFIGADIIIKLILYLYSWTKLDVIKVLPAKTVYNAFLLSYFMPSLVKVYYLPSEVKANCSWEAIEIGDEQNILAKSTVVKYLSVHDCMESVISIILSMGP